MQRASEFRVQDGVTLRTCSAEDLVVFKAFAGREKDWLDIEGIALRQHGRLDERLIWSELTPLLELKDSSFARARRTRILRIPKPPPTSRTVSASASGTGDRMAST